MLSPCPRLYEHIDRLSTANAHGEYYLTDMAEVFHRARKKVVAIKTADAGEILGSNTRGEMMMLDARLRLAKCRQLLEQGVTIFYPHTCVIDSDVEVGADTVIEPFVQLLGNTKIGEDCRIRSYSVIANSVLGDRVTVRPGTIMEDSRVAAGAVLGPYTHMRPGTEVGEDAHLGNFVETKKIKLGKGSKANHLTYLGDAEIGEGVNIGAGTITCNYDGVNKHKTVIEDGVFIGSDATLVAPVKIGRGAYVAAASCITGDVPADALALGRARQSVKEGWAREKREKQKEKKSLVESRASRPAGQRPNLNSSRFKTGMDRAPNPHPRRRVFSMSVESWKVIFDWATVVLIALTVFSGAGALITGDILSKRQQEKLREFQKELTNSQTKLSEQQERTLALQKQLIAQGSRAQLLWPEETRNRIIEQLTPFSKQKAEISFCAMYLTDNESMGLAMNLRGLLEKSGWAVTPLVMSNLSGTGMTISVSPRAPKSTLEAADTLLSVLMGVPFEVTGKKVLVHEPARSPQLQTIQDGKEWKWEPPTDDTVFVGIYAHP